MHICKFVKTQFLIFLLRAWKFMKPEFLTMLFKFHEFMKSQCFALYSDTFNCVGKFLVALVKFHLELQFFF